VAHRDVALRAVARLALDRVGDHGVERQRGVLVGQGRSVDEAAELRLLRRQAAADGVAEAEPVAVGPVGAAEVGARGPGALPEVVLTARGQVTEEHLARGGEVRDPAPAVDAQGDVQRRGEGHVLLDDLTRSEGSRDVRVVRKPSHPRRVVVGEGEVAAVAHVAPGGVAGVALQGVRVAEVVAGGRGEGVARVEELDAPAVLIVPFTVPAAVRVVRLLGVDPLPGARVAGPGGVVHGRVLDLVDVVQLPGELGLQVVGQVVPRTLGDDVEHRGIEGIDVRIDGAVARLAGELPGLVHAALDGAVAVHLDAGVAVDALQASEPVDVGRGVVDPVAVEVLELDELVVREAVDLLLGADRVEGRVVAALVRGVVLVAAELPLQVGVEVDPGALELHDRPVGPVVAVTALIRGHLAGEPVLVGVGPLARVEHDVGERVAVPGVDRVVGRLVVVDGHVARAALAVVVVQDVARGAARAAEVAVAAVGALGADVAARAGLVEGVLEHGLLGGARDVTQLARGPGHQLRHVPRGVVGHGLLGGVGDLPGGRGDGREARALGIGGQPVDEAGQAHAVPGAAHDAGHGAHQARAAGRGDLHVAVEQSARPVQDPDVTRVDEHQPVEPLVAVGGGGIVEAGVLQADVGQVVEVGAGRGIEVGVVADHHARHRDVGDVDVHGGAVAAVALGARQLGDVGLLEAGVAAHAGLGRGHRLGAGLGEIIRLLGLTAVGRQAEVRTTAGAGADVGFTLADQLVGRALPLLAGAAHEVGAGRTLGLGLAAHAARAAQLVGRHDRRVARPGLAGGPVPGTAGEGARPRGHRRPLGHAGVSAVHPAAGGREAAAAELHVVSQPGGAGRRVGASRQTLTPGGAADTSLGARLGAARGDGAGGLALAPLAIFLAALHALLRAADALAIAALGAATVADVGHAPLAGRVLLATQHALVAVGAGCEARHRHALGTGEAAAPFTLALALPFGARRDGLAAAARSQQGCPSAEDQ